MIFIAITWILLGLSLLFLLFGYVIKYKLQIGETKGENSSPYRDGAGLAKWMGSQWIFIGILGVMITMIGFIMPELRVKLMQAFLLMTVIVILRIQRGVRRFY